MEWARWGSARLCRVTKALCRSPCKSIFHDDLSVMSGSSRTFEAERPNTGISAVNISSDIQLGITLCGVDVHEAV